MRFQRVDNLTSIVLEQLSAQLPVVLFRRPQETIVNAVLQSTDTLNVFTNFDDTGFVFCNYAYPLNSFIIKNDKLLNGEFETVPHNNSVEFQETESDKKTYSLSGKSC